ncbi:MAG: hypothetical protein COA90_07065 [Gammaproteobacteria bacterium]|nr:MAG: hypothetical protein COA90_07065 [Gammaproteobacteria bacterium]
MVFINRKVNLSLLILAFFFVAGCASNNTIPPSPTKLEFKLGSFDEFSGSVSYRTNDEFDKVVYVNDKAVLTASHIESVDYTASQFLPGAYDVVMELDDVGTKILAEITTNHLGQVMALIINEQVVLAATIYNPIMYGQFIISGIESLDKEKAKKLKKKIRRAMKSAD